MNIWEIFVYELKGTLFYIFFCYQLSFNIHVILVWVYFVFIYLLWNLLYLYIFFLVMATVYKMGKVLYMKFYPNPDVLVIFIVFLLFHFISLYVYQLFNEDPYHFIFYILLLWIELLNFYIYKCVEDFVSICCKFCFVINYI